MAEQLSEKMNRKPRLRYSLGTLLLLMTVICLAIALAIVYTKYSRAERQLTAMMPMSVEEVARRFEESTQTATTKIKVTDVRHSAAENAYKITFSWKDATTGQEWATDVKLVSDGFGVYFGKVYSSEFLKSVGSKNDYYVVAISTPSPLQAER